jgi:Zn-dependent metalloprotease
MAEHAAAFGVTSDAVAFVSKRQRARADRQFVHLEQTYAELPVFAAEAVVQVDGAGSIEFVLADLARPSGAVDGASLDTEPSLTADEAIAAGIAYLEAEFGTAALRRSLPTLMVFDSGVVAEPGAFHLVWEVFLDSEANPWINEHLLVDAHDGSVVRHYPLNRDARYREIYDASNTSADPGVLWREEGDPPADIVDVDRAYEYLGDVWWFYDIWLGRDSLDDNGMVVSATVRYCRDGSPCPYNNAFWRPGLFANRLYFGQDYAVQDIVAHEFTHGVTSFESNLVYENESGAINEFLSDAFAEFVDQTVLDSGTDGYVMDWLIGEDLPGGEVRDMQDPPNPPDPDVMDASCDFDGNLRQPDRMGSPYWYSGTCDLGGVHINCGVGNKLCYLLTDGDTFNGQTVEGMGIDAVSGLLYEANRDLLPSGADYRDLGDVLEQAAVNEYWSTGDRNNLYRALKAVEIASSVDVYVDAAWWGPEFGTELFPYNTVTEGYDASYPGDRLKIKAGTYNETLTFRKIMKLEPRDGTVRIEP